VAGCGGSRQAAMDRGAASDRDRVDTGRGLTSVRHEIAPNQVFRKTPLAR